MISNGPAHPVVIVEDDPFDLALLQNELASLGTELPLLVYNDGAEAIRALQKLPELPSHFLPRIIFVDLFLPNIDGATLIRWLRLQPALAHIPVVVISGSENPADIDAAFACGASDFLKKPADAAVLAELLELPAEA